MTGSPTFTGAQCAPRALTFGVAASASLVVLGVAIAALVSEDPKAALFLIPVLPGVAILLYCLAIFRCLRVDVYADRIELAFGGRGTGCLRGPRKRIDLGRVVAVRPSRSRALYGWGMRWTPRGWLWNVWGLDVVELTYTNGRHFLIGTDRPTELAAAIERRLAAPRG